MSIESTVKYYKDLMLYQYQMQPKAAATIDLLIRQAICDLVPVEIANSFDIENSEGAQLDLLGKYIGVNRKITLELERDFFSFASYESPTVAVTGFTDYSDPSINESSEFFRYAFSGGSGYSLTDDEYRTVLKMKLIGNTTDNSLKSVNDALNELFNGAVGIIDEKDMSLTVVVSPLEVKVMRIAYAAGAIPRPQGVGLNGAFKKELPYFAFANSVENNGNQTGFSNATTGEFSQYQFLSSLDKIA